MCRLDQPPVAITDAHGSARVALQRAALKADDQAVLGHVDDGASAHAFGDIVDAALALLWGALDEYAEEDGAVVVVDTMPEEAATGDGDDAAR